MNVSRSSANLDLLRAIAVVAVFVDHLSSTLGGVVLGSLGRFGVILFFIHTSRVLMASLERLHEPTVPPLSLTAMFGIRRIFRIYPLCAVTVLTVTWFQIPRTPHSMFESPQLIDVLSNMALTQSFTHSPILLGVLWSLPYEVQMYVLLPLIYLVVKRFPGASAWLWLVALAAVTIPAATGKFWVLWYAPCFMAGVVAYDFARRFQPRLPAWLWPVAILAAILLYGPLDDELLQDKPLRVFGLSLALGAMLPLSQEVQSVPVARYSALIARYSYGIYLVHVPLMWLAFFRMGTFEWPARVGVFVILNIALPVALYHGLEAPLIKLGARLSQNFRVVNNAVRPSAATSSTRPMPTLNTAEVSEQLQAHPSSSSRRCRGLEE